MMKKLVTLFLALCLSATFVLAGAESLEEADWAKRTKWVSWSSDLPFSEETTELTIVTLRGPDTAAWDQKWFWAWAAQAMNVKFEVIEIDSSERNEKLNLLFASDDLPDIFYNCGLTENEVTTYGLKEHQLIPLNNLIDQYAPNIKAFMNAEPSVAATFYHIDNNIYQLPSYIGYNALERYTTLRAWINNQWLTNLGLENPDTLDGYYNVLKAFKEQDANGNGDATDEIPLSDTPSNITRLFLNLMGAMTREYSTLKPAIYNNKVIIPANDKGFYRSYLTEVNKFYTDGLINQDMFTLTTAQIQADAAADIIGSHVQGAPHVLPVKDYTLWTSLKAMTSAYNDTPKWPETNSIVHGQFAISYKCKNLDAAIKFADWHFTWEGAMYTWVGPMEGSEDLLGQIGGWYYDEELGNYTCHFPEGMEQNNINYIRFIGPATHTHVGLSANDQALQIQLGHLFRIPAAGAGAYWRANADRDWVPYYSPCYPIVYFTEEVNNRVTELQTPLQDYITIMEAKFISGEESMDGFDKYFENLQGMGMSEFAQYYTDAYANYLNNLK